MTSLTSSRIQSGMRDASLSERLARRAFLRLMRNLSTGRLVLEDTGQRHVFGPDAPGGELDVHVQIHDPAFYVSALLEGSAGVGRSYMDGEWDCDDLARLIRVFARNSGTLQRWRSGAQRALAPAQRAWLWAHRNTLGGSRRNIHAHYDLGNDFFETFLDPSMMYSSAIYPHKDSTLEEASLEKIHRICRKLDLRPEDRLLEIGTGWGGFAVVAARDYGCHVTTVTISEEQFDYAMQRILEAGLEDRITVLLRDYREMEGQFDKLVSIEMIEAVGVEHLETYTEACGRLLAPHGRMLLQAITIDDRVYESAARTVDFIKKYIFPGSFIPSSLAIATSMAKTTDLRLVHTEEFGEHYARTVRDWHDRFVAASDTIRSMGFDASFLRRWRFYFKYCEGGFSERRIGVQQLLYSKPADRSSVPMGAL
jgi:cyclopropane-fatty-acyl-phospholipid synthase